MRESQSEAAFLFALYRSVSVDTIFLIFLALTWSVTARVIVCFLISVKGTLAGLLFQNMLKNKRFSFWPRQALCGVKGPGKCPEMTIYGYLFPFCTQGPEILQTSSLKGLGVGKGTRKFSCHFPLFFFNKLFFGFHFPTWQLKISLQLVK